MEVLSLEKEVPIDSTSAAGSKPTKEMVEKFVLSEQLKQSGDKEEGSQANQEKKTYSKNCCEKECPKI